MINTTEIRYKLKSLLDKFSHRFYKPELLEFNPESTEAQKMVWENQNASMQDKSYSFDEESTDADYEFEDDFEFEDEDDISRSRESRYS